MTRKQTIKVVQRHADPGYSIIDFPEVETITRKATPERIAKGPQRGTATGYYRVSYKGQVRRAVSVPGHGLFLVNGE